MKKEMVLWGWREGYCEGAIQLTDNVSPAEQKRWQAKCWKTAVYEKGVRPEGFLDQIKSWTNK